MTRPLAPLLLPLLAAVSAGAELAPPFGAWEVRGAHVELVDDGGAVVGRLALAGGPCPVAVGTELLRGTLLDDSLSAQVRLCLLAEECAAEEGSALAVLLVGKQLSGGVHSRKACAGNARSLVLRRSGTPQALRAPPGAERLSRTRAPKSPRQVPSMVARADKERASPASPLLRQAGAPRPGDLPGGRHGRGSRGQRPLSGLDLQAARPTRRQVSARCAQAISDRAVIPAARVERALQD